MVNCVLPLVYITIIFISVFIGFVIAALSWLTPGHLPGRGVGTFYSSSQNSYVGAYPGGSGRLPGTTR